MNILQIKNRGRIITFNLNNICNVILTSDILGGRSKIEDAKSIIFNYGSDHQYLSFDDPKEAKETYDKIVEAMKNTTLNIQL